MDRSRVDKELIDLVMIARESWEREDVVYALSEIVPRIHQVPENEPEIAIEMAGLVTELRKMKEAMDVNG